MVTTVSEVNVREGSEAAWDDLMRETGGGEDSTRVDLGTGAETGRRRRHQEIVIGTWESRDAWAAWHHDPGFQKTRELLDQLEAGSRQQWWHEITVAAATEGSAAALDEAGR